MTPFILSADEHTMISRGLRLVLEQEFGFTQLTSVTSGEALLNELKKTAYSHLILDVFLADGSVLEILPAIRCSHASLNIMVFSGRPAALYQRVLRQYGIYYYLHKRADEKVAIQTLRRFLYGEPLRIPHQQEPCRDNPFTLLTPRETEILHYLLKGWGSNEIGDTLHLRQNTISTVKGRIFEKTETSNLHELIELAHIFKVER